MHTLDEIKSDWSQYSRLKKIRIAIAIMKAKHRRRCAKCPEVCHYERFVFHRTLHYIRVLALVVFGKKLEFKRVGVPYWKKPGHEWETIPRLSLFDLDEKIAR